MSAANLFEADLLKHIFQNTDIATVGDATGLRGSATAGVLYVSLHTVDPNETGLQNSNEATYGSYARVSVARSAAAWAVAGTNPTTADNVSAINFPAATSGSVVVTHFGIGTAASGAGVLLFSGALAASLTVNAGVTPSFAAGALDITCD